MQPPAPDEYFEYYGRHVALVSAGDVIDIHHLGVLKERYLG